MCVRVLFYRHGDINIGGNSRAGDSCNVGGAFWSGVVSLMRVRIVVGICFGPFASTGTYETCTYVRRCCRIALAMASAVGMRDDCECE